MSKRKQSAIHTTFKYGKCTQLINVISLVSSLILFSQFYPTYATNTKEVVYHEAIFQGVQKYIWKYTCMSFASYVERPCSFSDTSSHCKPVTSSCL
jgi:hypothetical protein